MTEIYEKKKKLSTKIWFYIAVIFYKFTLDIIYVAGIVPHYEYTGFVYNFSGIRLFFSSIVLIIMSVPMEKMFKKKTFSSIVGLLLSFAYFIPGLTLYSLAGYSEVFFYFGVLYWGALFFIIIAIGHIKKTKILIKGNFFIFDLVLFSFAFFMIFISAYYTGFRVTFDLTSSTELRFASRELSMPSLFRYLLSSSYIILPIGTAYNYINKNRSKTIILVIAQILGFSFNGKKSVLFMLIVIFLVSIFFNRKHIRLLFTAFPLLNILTLIEITISSETSYLAKFIHRRAMLTPNSIALRYIDFFSNNELLYLRSSILKYVVTRQPYDIPISRLIGYYYSGSYDVNANTGLLGDAFANFGWFSLLLYPLMIGVLLLVFEVVSRDIDIQVLAVVWILVTYKIMSGSFFTLFLTGGFFLLIIMLFFYPREKNLNILEKSNWLTGSTEEQEKLHTTGPI